MQSGLNNALSISWRLSLWS